MPGQNQVPFSYQAPGDAAYQPAWRHGTLFDCTLVLEGGAMRGQFTAGVLDFLMDQGILPDTVVGVSAGALNGYNYKAGLRGRSAYLNIKYSNDWRYFSMRSFALTGNVLNSDFAFHQIPEALEPFDFGAFQASPIQLYTVASDLVSGEADYHLLQQARTELDWLRASASMPLVSQIVEVDGRKLLDGGCCDSVPIGFAQNLSLVNQQKSQKIIVVLTRDAQYLKSPYRLMPLARRVYHDYPYFLERMEYRHYEYNRQYRQIARMEAAGELFVLRPPEPVAVHSMEHDPEKLYQLYLIGYGEAQRRALELLDYLS